MPLLLPLRSRFRVTHSEAIGMPEYIHKIPTKINLTFRHV